MLRFDIEAYLSQIFHSQFKALVVYCIHQANSSSAVLVALSQGFASTFQQFKLIALVIEFIPQIYDFLPSFGSVSLLPDGCCISRSFFNIVLLFHICDKDGT